MAIQVLPVRTPQQLNEFLRFPWVVNHGDTHWVPPILKERKNKLDPVKNQFWRTAERELFLAVKDGKTAGTITAIVDHHSNKLLNIHEGQFGFFDALNDQEVVDALLREAERWVAARGMDSMRGPFNPSPTDECGILIEGFESRPALLEAHNPYYYAALIEKSGYSRVQEMVARMATASPDARDIHTVMSEKLMKVVTKLKERTDIRLRKVNLSRWTEDVSLACDIYNRALQPLPGFVPVPEEEFQAFANDFKAILDPDLALLAEIRDKPVGFALALPDITRALQNANGHMGLLGMLNVWLDLRKPRRGTFKILMVLPEFQNRGIETLLVLEVARAAFSKGYREMDMSLTGSENEKSNRFQENLGYRVYRRYAIYQKQI